MKKQDAKMNDELNESRDDCTSSVQKGECVSGDSGSVVLQKQDSVTLHVSSLNAKCVIRPPVSQMLWKVLFQYN